MLSGIIKVANEKEKLFNEIWNFISSNFTFFFFCI